MPRSIRNQTSRSILTRFMLPILLLLLIQIFLVSCSNQVNKPHTSRDFYMGVVPTPRNWPDSTENDIIASYKQTSQVAEVVMLWIEEQGIGQYQVLSEKKIIEGMRVYGLEPIITLSFATLVQLKGKGLAYTILAPPGLPSNLSNNEFRERWKKEATDIARDYKPLYLSLGNEINDYFYLFPEQLNDYISLAKETKQAIKEVSPHTRVMVVLSYNHLIDNKQWKLFRDFSFLDAIGLTTYPWKHYPTPSEISDDYYKRIRGYTSLPIAFTEIGWPDENQAEFLDRFIELTEGLDIEMINWLFLHEMEFKGTLGAITEPEVGKISLYYKNSTPKEVYYHWIRLKTLRLNREN